MVFHDAEIITDSDKVAIMGVPRSCRTEMLFTKFAMKLSTGNMSLFYKISQWMQMLKKNVNIQQLAAKMQEKFEAIDQKEPTGMYICTHYTITLCTSKCVQ